MSVEVITLERRDRHEIDRAVSESHKIAREMDEVTTDVAAAPPLRKPGQSPSQIQKARAATLFYPRFRPGDEPASAETGADSIKVRASETTSGTSTRSCQPSQAGFAPLRSSGSGVFARSIHC